MVTTRQWTRLALGTTILGEFRGAIALPNCPIQGQEFPEPQNLADHPIWKQAITSLKAVYDWHDLDEDGVTGATNFSYSVQVYSSNPGQDILFDRHHTAPNLPLLNSSGVTEVDQRTVYRLGSITKVFTVLTWLAVAGDDTLSDPVAKYLPEIAGYIAENQNRENDGVYKVDWEDITIGALMGQMSGIMRDLGILGEITEKISQEIAPWVGLPHLPEDEMPACGAYPLCNRTQFFEGILKLPPSFKPWSTPAYSNIAYQLLAYSLEAIDGKPYSEILDERILKPLGLSDTYYWMAPEEKGILPGTAQDTWWYAVLGESSPTGNMYASAGDLTKLGLAILRSDILPPVMTRRWLRPVAFSSDLYAAVGLPWGLRRIPVSTTNPHKVLTAFSKAGSFRMYGALISIMPEWNLGFTIMMAGDITGSSIFRFADYLGASLFPAYQAVARDQARQNLGGLYVAEERVDPVTNMTMYPSNITIRADDDKPGLYATPWNSNGVNMVDYAMRLASGINQAGTQKEVRLYYTGLSTDLPDGGRKISFKAVFEDTGYDSTTAETAPKLFSTDCAAWLQFTGATYGHLPLDEFVFELDADGQAVSVENLGLRVTMKRVDGPVDDGGGVSGSTPMGGVPEPGQEEEDPGQVVPQPEQEPAEQPGQEPVSGVEGSLDDDEDLDEDSEVMEDEKDADMEDDPVFGEEKEETDED